MRTLSVNGTVLDDNITLLSINYGYASVTNYNDWLKYSLQPQWYGQDITYTTAEIELLVEADSITELEKACSDVYALMRGEATVRDSLSDFSLVGHITSCEDTKLNSKARVITISFEGIKEGDEKTISSLTIPGKTGTTVEVEGNADVPCKITITPDTSYVTLTLVINENEYQFANVDDTMTLVLDSVNGLILNGEDSAVSLYQSWSMPYMQGGTNTIACLEGYPSIEITYNGRWM